MMLMKFNSVKSVMPIHDQKDIVKINMEIRPNKTKHLIFRQIRGAKYEMKGGKYNVDLRFLDEKKQKKS